MASAVAEMVKTDAADHLKSTIEGISGAFISGLAAALARDLESGAGNELVTQAVIHKVSSVLTEKVESGTGNVLVAEAVHREIVTTLADKIESGTCSPALLALATGALADKIEADSEQVEDATVTFNETQQPPAHGSSTAE
jgi:hypothetical protein